MVPAAFLRSLPRGTRYEPSADGFRLALPEGEIRVRARRAAPRLPAGPLEPGIERLVTWEGEEAAFDRRRAVAAVFAEESVRLLSGTADTADLVRRLALELPLGLAYRRRRSFRYQPPPGWAGRLRHGLIAEWRAAGALLTVFPARPYGESPAGDLDRRLHELSWAGYRRESLAGPEQVKQPLPGERWSLEGTWPDGGRAATELVTLSDATFLYVVRLDHDGTRPGEPLAALDRLVRSIVPIPPRTADFISACVVD